MSTLTIGNNITFHYTDSGPPNESNEYSTIFIIHGHTFHSGTFRRLSPLAASLSLRVICIDRREYQGSSPHTLEELRIIMNGSQNERSQYFADQGVLLALAIDSLVQSLDLPVQGGGTLAGWSMGHIYTMSIINAIDHPDLPQNAKDRLKTFVRTYIIWETPSQQLGVETQGYMPLWDSDLPEDVRGPAFGKWVASFFDHDADAIVSRDVSHLNQRAPSSQTSTVDKMTQEELLSIADFLPGPKCETIISEPPYYKVHSASVQKAFFDSDSSMNKWGMTNVWHIYGDKCSWNVLLAAWVLEDKDKANKRIKFRPIEGTNHFLMWEDPELAINVLKECIDSSS